MLISRANFNLTPCSWSWLFWRSKMTSLRLLPWIGWPLTSTIWSLTWIALVRSAKPPKNCRRIPMRISMELPSEKQTALNNETILKVEPSFACILSFQQMCLRLQILPETRWQRNSPRILVQLGNADGFGILTWSDGWDIDWTRSFSTSIRCQSHSQRFSFRQEIHCKCDEFFSFFWNSLICISVSATPRPVNIR